MPFTTFRAAALALALGGLAACTSDPLNTAGRPDGAPGNPPGTEASRANARAGDPLNAAGRPDGTPGNPTGTAVSRANDRVGDPLNVNNTRDCTPGNPPGTAVSRALGTTDADTCAPARSTRRSARSARRSSNRSARPAVSRTGPSGQTSPGVPSNTFGTQGS